MSGLTFFVQAFVALFVVVDPIGNVPLFIGLLARFREKARVRMVRRAVVIAFLVLLAFTFFGNALFSLLGVSVYSFRIAGGILLLLISIELLFGYRSRTLRFRLWLCLF